VQGVGLGLVICKLIVNKFDGQIDFISKYKVGSTFFFTFEVDDPEMLPPQQRKTLTNVLNEVEPLIQDYKKIPFI
jgi:nitrogen-specific signal transduction histidine kinase